MDRHGERDGHLRGRPLPSSGKETAEDDDDDDCSIDTCILIIMVMLWCNNLEKL